jgi:hypothetical protein
MLALLSCAAFASAQSTLTEPFDTLRSDLWLLNAGEPGRAALDDGKLILDLTEAKRGKWAYAELHQGITLPARIEWDQCPAHDSVHTYFAGLLVWSLADKAGQQLSAGLGGGGLQRCAFLGPERGPDRIAEEGVWYHLTLDLQPAEQTLTLSRRGEAEPLLSMKANVGLARSPFMLAFFQNDPRLGPAFVDEYDQDRGATWIDNLTISAEKTQPATPPPPGTTYPYKVPVVFNRATRWITPADGLSRGCITYEAAERMLLTGAQSVSRWLRLERWDLKDPTAFPEQPCIEDSAEHRTLFRLPTGETEATFALRALQWDIEQHPVMEWDADAEGVEWDLELTATDGVRPFTWRLWKSEAATGRTAGRLDALKTYRDAGRPNRHAEMDFLLRLRATGDTAEPRQVKLWLALQGQEVIIPRAPIVVPEEEVRREGVTIEAIFVGGYGGIDTNDRRRLEAHFDGRRVPMQRVGGGGVWRGILRDLPVGEHTVKLVGGDAKATPAHPTTVSVTVTDLPYLDHYDQAMRSYCTPEGKAAGPLLGDLIAWIPYKTLAPESRELAFGRDAAQDVILTKWRSVPQADIDRYVQYMAESGVRVLRITPNVSVAEYYLDAGGHLAMHGFEQLSYILAAARRHGLRCVINLTHYPYLYPGTGNNPPVAQYFEAGYRHDFDWTSDRMWESLSGYLSELLGYIGDDPAVMAYTIAGENDQTLPVEWINRAHDLIKEHAPRQMVVLEQGGSIFECRDADPANYSVFRPAADGGVGFRTYDTYRYPNDCFMATAIRFFNLARPSHLGEVACGVNRTPQFITKLRDAMGLALTLQQPMAISWCATMLEDERRPLARAAERIDWTTFRRARPPVAIIIDKPDREQVQRLVQYEEALASIPLDYELIRPGAARQAYAQVLDARQPFAPPTLDPALAPLRVSPGSHTSYALSEDRRQLVAYIRNATHYEIRLCDINQVVERCRLDDQLRDLWLELPGIAPGLPYAVWGARSGAELAAGLTAEGTRLDLGSTSADVILVVAAP